MDHLIEVAFRGNRKEFFIWQGDAPPAPKSAVIVEADRGEDLGRVHAIGELADLRCRGCSHGCGTGLPERKALRVASAEDIIVDLSLTPANEEARRAAMQHVKANGLAMKLTDAEWQWDRRKLTIFFTAEKRVDFRVLVRDLASHFKTRIELKQIGVRDEARRLGGIGRGGRVYCSASWLPELRPVNLGVAKDQKLSLNPQQISGACGRLMCCLRYEHEFYVESRRKFPKEGKIINTALGEEKVIHCDIFHEKVSLRSVEGDMRVLTLAQLQAEVKDHEASLLSTTMEHQVALDQYTDQVLDAETISMLDTQEFRTFVLDSSRSELRRDAGLHQESRPEQQTEPQTEPQTESQLEPPAEPLPEAGLAAAADADADEDTEAEADDSPRRKRRRGRRGGRRLRATEERRMKDHPDDGGSD